MEQIRHINQLPKWFNNDNYKGVYNLSLIDWFFELSVRNTFYKAPISLSLGYKTPKPIRLRTQYPIDGLRFQDEHEADEEVRFIDKSYFGRCTYVPVRISQKCLDYSKHYKDCSIESCGEIVLNKPATSGQFYKSCNFITLQQKSAVTEIKFDPNIRDLTHRYDDFFNNARMKLRSGRHILTINLYAPDKKIMNDFTKWLDAQRERDKSSSLAYKASMGKNRSKGKIPVVSENTLHSWFSCGLLPYLDLYQWALLNRKHITYPVYGEAIFGSDKFRGDKAGAIKDTTIKHAKNVTNILNKLSQQLHGCFAPKDVNSDVKVYDWYNDSIGLVEYPGYEILKSAISGE